MATEVDAREQTLRFRALTVVAQGEDYLVGDPVTGVFIAVPLIGARVLAMLRDGASVGACTSRLAAEGLDVDVADFARTLCELAFAEPAEPTGPGDSGDGPPVTGNTVERRPWAGLVTGPAAWALTAVAAVGVAALFLARPALVPRVNDMFFLDTPIHSVVAVILATFAFSAAHEGCHWLAARAEGVRSRIRISRRMYMLVFETDLTRLWSLPRRRRFWPLLAGMAFDVVVLFGAESARFAAAEGWWRPADTWLRALAALSFVEFFGLVPQFLIFLRTDLYAVLVVVTGCLDLWRVTSLTLRHRLGRATDEQRAVLAAAHPRDRTVARWFVWLYGAGLLLATWSFVAYFLPATARLVGSIAANLGGLRLGTWSFWESLLFAGVLLSSRAMTLAVAARDLLRRLAARSARRADHATSSRRVEIT